VVVSAKNYAKKVTRPNVNITEYGTACWYHMGASAIQWQRKTRRSKEVHMLHDFQNLSLQQVT